MYTRSKPGHISYNMKNKITAFLFGDLTVTLLQISTNFWQELGDFGVKLIATFTLGVAGGLAGLIAKELLWPKIKKLLKVKTKNNG